MKTREKLKAVEQRQRELRARAARLEMELSEIGGKQDALRRKRDYLVKLAALEEKKP